MASEDDTLLSGDAVRKHKKNKKHKKHKTSDGEPKHSKSRKSKHKKKSKDHENEKNLVVYVDDGPRNKHIKLDDNSLQDLEAARAVLEAKLCGRTVTIDNSRIPTQLASAMTQIADDYHSDSEEDGEIEHDTHKARFISSKINVIAAEISDSGCKDHKQKQSSSNGNNVKHIKSPYRRSPPSHSNASRGDREVVKDQDSHKNYSSREHARRHDIPEDDSRDAKPKTKERGHVSTNSTSRGHMSTNSTSRGHMSTNSTSRGHMSTDSTSRGHMSTNSTSRGHMSTDSSSRGHNSTSRGHMSANSASGDHVSTAAASRDRRDNYRRHDDTNRDKYSGYDRNKSPDRPRNLRTASDRDLRNRDLVFSSRDRYNYNRQRSSSPSTHHSSRHTRSPLPRPSPERCRGRSRPSPTRRRDGYNARDAESHGDHDSSRHNDRSQGSSHTRSSVKYQHMII